MAISKKSWLGVGRETTPGTAVATPTHYVPCKSTFKNVRKQEYLMEERGTRDKDYDAVPTTRHSTWDVKGPLYPDAHGYFLLGAFGNVTSVAQTDVTVFKHTFALADVPPSFTLTKSFDAVTYSSAYATVSKFNIKLSAEKLIECDASGEALWMTKVVAPPTPNFSTTKPFAGYAPTITLGGSVSNDIEDLEIDFVQKVTLFYPANGQPDFVTAYFGEREVSIKYTARFDNDTVYQKFLNDTTDSLVLDVKGPIISTTFAEEFNVSIPNLVYDSMDHDLGKDNVLIKAAGKAIVGGGSSLISAYLINAYTSYTA